MMRWWWCRVGNLASESLNLVYISRQGSRWLWRLIGSVIVTGIRMVWLVGWIDNRVVSDRVVRMMIGGYVGVRSTWLTGNKLIARLWCCWMGLGDGLNLFRFWLWWWWSCRMRCRWSGWSGGGAARSSRWARRFLLIPHGDELNLIAVMDLLDMPFLLHFISEQPVKLGQKNRWPIRWFHPFAQGAVVAF